MKKINWVETTLPPKLSDPDLIHLCEIIDEDGSIREIFINTRLSIAFSRVERSSEDFNWYMGYLG